MILAWLLHVIYSTVIGYGLAHCFGGLSPAISAISLILGGLIGLRQARGFLKTNRDYHAFVFAPGEAGGLELVLSVLILYAATRHFMWMLFPLEFNWATLSLNNYGDLPMHINFIEALANGIHFPPRNPIYASELLRYPYGIDLYNALWEQVGVRLQGHLAVVGILGTLASLIFLRAFGGWAAIGAFFFSGGLAGWEVVRGQPLADFLHNVDWKNLFLTVFITQRGMLIALPVGLFLITSFRRHLSGEAVLSKRQLRQLGIVWGTMPLFHLHAFVALSLLLAAVALEFAGWSGVIKFLKSRPTLWAFIPATYFVLFSTGGLQKASVVRFHWGWVSHEGDRMRFIIENFGPWLFVPLIIAGYLFFARRKFEESVRRRLWIEFLVYALMFIFFYNVMFAPWEWDNIKLLIWPYLGFARLLWVVLDSGSDQSSQGRLIGNFERPIFALVLFFSGMVTIAWTLQEPVGRAGTLYLMGELASTKGALADVPKDAVFLAAPSHLHQLTYFGMLRAVGYEGHLWSHGIDARDSIDKLKRIMAGDPDSIALARGLGVTHIFWGPLEKAQFGDADLPWMHLLTNVSRVPGFAIYAVK